MPNPGQTQKTTQNRYYFDRTFLLKYVNQKVKTKVFVDGRFLDIGDASDLEDELHGVGYDNAGNPKFFDYRSIEQIKAGTNLLTLDQLQQLQNKNQQGATPEEEPSEDETDSETPPEGEEPLEEPEGAEPPGEEEEPEPEEPEEPKSGGKQPQKAHYDPYAIGRLIINESMEKKKRTQKELNKMVRILERPYYNVTGVITEVFDTDYEIRPLSGLSGRIIISKENVKFL